MIDTYLDNNCFMAHCFTMNSPYGTVYDRINYSISHRQTNELCTSTIRDGDISPRNFFADVGVVISSCKVTFCSPRDGATKRINGVLFFDDEYGVEEPDESQIENAIVNRMSYNEFLLTNYTVIGFFISNDHYGRQHAIQTIGSISNFYNNTKHCKLPYYYLTDGKLELVQYNKKSGLFDYIKTVQINELYRPTLLNKLDTILTRFTIRYFGFNWRTVRFGR